MATLPYDEADICSDVDFAPPGGTASASAICSATGSVTGYEGRTWQVGNFSGSATSSATFNQIVARAYLVGTIAPYTYAYASTAGTFFQYFTITNHSIARLTVENTFTGTVRTSGQSYPWAYTAAEADMYVGTVSDDGFFRQFIAGESRQLFADGSARLFAEILLADAPATTRNTYAVRNWASAFVMGTATDAASERDELVTSIMGAATIRAFDANGAEIVGGFVVSDEMPPVNSVPEPATMTLLATGLAGLAAARRRNTAKRG